jgi:hypothetical protein
MITTADTLQVMMIVAACHHRTAPRMDDRDAALAIARIWTDLFDCQGFTVTELIAAVKKRAKVLPDAPEPADILRVARATRADEYERETDEEREARQNELERKIAPDVKAITRKVSYGPARSTPRLTAARDAIDDCEGKRESQSAISEYLKALSEARQGVLVTHSGGTHAQKIAAARQALDAEQPTK